MTSNQKGLSVNPSGIVAFLRFLWGIPVVRQTAGWLIQQAMSAVLKRLKAKRDRKTTPKSGTPS